MNAGRSPWIVTLPFLWKLTFRYVHPPSDDFLRQLAQAARLKLRCILLGTLEPLRLLLALGGFAFEFRTLRIELR
jgi:hypothetical protein